MSDFIRIKGARVHNLKNISVDLPRNKIIVFTGLSGSGKSSLAFDTIYAEGQRRYVESLSAYARQFLEQLDKPDVDSIEGLSPAISIDQKTASHNPRSIVGTVTEIYDYMRLLFASIGIPHCPECHRKIKGQSIQEIHTHLMTWPLGTKIMVLSPLIQGKKGEYKSLIQSIREDGFVRLQIDGKLININDEIDLDKNKKHSIDIVVDRLTISEENSSRLFESIESATKQSKGLVNIVNLDTQQTTLFSEALSCPHCQISLPEISPRLFSFNAPYGACPDCKGLGDKMDFDPALIISDPHIPIRISTQKCINLDQTYFGRIAETAFEKENFTLDHSFSQLTDHQKHVLLYGKVRTENRKNYYYQSFSFSRHWEGIITNLKRRYFQTQSENMRYFFQSFMSAHPCETCKGLRLSPAALAITVQNKHIADLIRLSASESFHFFSNLKLTQQEKIITHQIMKEILERLGFLINVGLGYLTLDRKANTLSGGESQRIRLATQIGSGLTGVLYVLDEPSIGLHQKDNQRLLQTLKRLNQLGNTLIIVEHDEETILSADHIVDIGPKAGNGGGKIIFSGSKQDFLKNEADSITAQYITKNKVIPLPNQYRKQDKNKELKIINAHENNLHHIDVTFPLGLFICVTGVSGSGKSTLISEILQKALNRHFYRSKDRPGKHDTITGIEWLDKVISIDQSPIGRTPRSNPATYTNTFTPIRELFAKTKEARIRGHAPGRFSFNVKGGRCEACEGDGVKKIEMHFLSDVYITCEVCKGKRYNNETLAVKYKGYSISDVLNMTVNEAARLFENIPIIYNKLQTIIDVGLGYIHLGQNATTLSGGEAQRVKLSKELSKKSTGKTMYLLDEPTTGLHFEDIRHLLKVLNQLVDTGNTVIVIEHNLDVIKTADHIIDLGPDGGNNGGKLIATGTPKEVSLIQASYTGNYLKKTIS